MGFFGGKQEQLVGLDIGSTSIKLVELERGGGRYRVSRYAIKSLPRKAVQEHAIVDAEQVSDSIRSVVKRAGSKRKHAAIAIPGAHVMSKTIGMPSGMTDEELEQQIEFEADHYIPYPLEEVNLDFAVLGRSKQNPEEDDVLISACRRVVMDDYVATVEGAGLELKVVDVDTFAMERAFELIAEQQTGGGIAHSAAIFNIGFANMNLNVLENGTSIYTRDHSFGGNRLTKQIQKRYGLGSREAERAKRSGGLPEGYKADLLEPFMETICQEAVRALQFYYSSSGKNEVDQILLCGGGSSIPRLEELMASRSGVPTSMGNPFASMSTGIRVSADKLERDMPSMMVCCGLALRNFD